MKIAISICRLKSEHNYSETKRQKNVRSMNGTLKTRGIKHSFVAVCHPIKILATRLSTFILQTS